MIIYCDNSLYRLNWLAIQIIRTILDFLSPWFHDFNFGRRAISFLFLKVKYSLKPFKSWYSFFDNDNIPHSNTVVYVKHFLAGGIDQFSFSSEYKDIDPLKIWYTVDFIYIIITFTIYWLFPDIYSCIEAQNYVTAINNLNEFFLL